MEKATLVIMAAGIGSRFGSGIKQLTPVGPNGEVIMDYSIYDAIKAGFNKVVFVIRKELEKDFRDVIGKRIEKIIETNYVYQELSGIPNLYDGKLEGRSKPWGTGQAILCCKDVVCEPFVVINADDYYGREAYRMMYYYLEGEWKKKDKICIGMVGFVLRNTLSENGTVTRGICKVNENHMLTEIEETYKIKKNGNIAGAEKEGEKIELNLDSVVSMNMWGMPARFIDVLEEGFVEFLKNLREDDKTTEYLLPKIIGELLQEGKVEVEVLKSRDRWFGVTYKEDKERVKREISNLISSGVYPMKLYK